MGWLWACLGGGPGSLGSKRSKSLRGKFNNQPHDLRLQLHPTQLPRHEYGVQNLQCKGHADGEAENIKIPTSSVSTCISINTLKKASEKSLESTFRQEFGLTMRSDVDELQVELAALRRRLANEEAEAKKLREEVSYLRSCGVLQRPEDSSDLRIFEREDARSGQTNGEHRLGDFAAVQPLRKCFSGRLFCASQSAATIESTKDSSDSSTMVSQPTQTRISSHRVGLSPKGKSFSHNAQVGEFDQKGDERVFASHSNPRVSKVVIAGAGLHQCPSAKVAAWTSQVAEESQGMSANLPSMNSVDVHWIKVSNAPAPCGFITNVSQDDRHSLNRAESPHRRPKLQALMVADDDVSKRIVGKRRQNRSVDFNEPTEKRSRESSPTSQLPALTPEEIEEQLSLAVVAFKEQKRELELKHQAFCHGPTMSNQQQQQQTANNAVGFYRNSRKKPVRSNRGFQIPLSPVKEALSIEEVTWSRQSSSSSKSEAFVKLDDSLERGPSKSAGTQGFKFAATIVEDSSPVKLPPEEDELETEGNEELEVRPSAMENIAMVPIQCMSPSLAPRRKSTSSAMDALCAKSSKAPTGSRYHVDDSVGTDWVHEWEDDDAEGLELKPIACASPSFSDRKKSSRSGSVRQSISFDSEESLSLWASAQEFDESFLSCGQSTPSPLGLAPFRSPASRYSVTPSPRKQWTPSPRNGMDPVMKGAHHRRHSGGGDAFPSINDVRRSKDGRLHTESISLGNSPAEKKTGGSRPPHAFSAEKKSFRRTFSWYGPEQEERLKTFGLKGRCGSDVPENKSLVASRMQVQQRLGIPTAKRAVPGSRLHARRFSDSDSGGSSTFSIDFNRIGNSRRNSLSSSQNGSSRSHLNESGGALDARESTCASLLRADKENFVARMGMSPSKTSILRRSDQSHSSSDSSNKALRESQGAIPENRAVLVSVPFNSLGQNVRTSRDKNFAALHTEDPRRDWNPVTSLQRAFPKVSSRGISGKIMARSKSSV